MNKVEALAKFLSVATFDLEYPNGNDNSDTFKSGREEYLVLTDNEADEMAREYILNSIWAFNPSFLAAHAREGISEDIFKAIQDNNCCEDNNKAIAALIEDLNHFVEDAIRADGRGHFLGNYDGEENESGDFYIYRTN